MAGFFQGGGKDNIFQRGAPDEHQITCSSQAFREVDPFQIRAIHKCPLIDKVHSRGNEHAGDLFVIPEGIGGNGGNRQPLIICRDHHIGIGAGADADQTAGAAAHGEFQSLAGRQISAGTNAIFKIVCLRLCCLSAAAEPLVGVFGNAAIPFKGMVVLFPVLGNEDHAGHIGGACQTDPFCLNSNR